MRRIVLGMVVVLAGCAAQQAATVTADQVTAKADQYAGVTWVDAPAIVEMQYPDTITYRLRGAIGGSFQKEGFASLRVEMSGSNWSFLQAALDSTGRRLPMNVVDRRVSGGGSVREIVSVATTRQYLEERRATGLDIEVRGRRGSVAVKLPPAYVEAFLTRFDAEVKASQ